MQRSARVFIIAGILIAVATFGFSYAAVKYFLPVPNTFVIETTYGISLYWDNAPVSSIPWGTFNPTNTSKTDVQVMPAGSNLHFWLKSTDSVPTGYCGYHTSGLPSFMTLTVTLDYNNGTVITWLPGQYYYVIHSQQAGAYNINMQLAVDWSHATAGAYSYNMTFEEADSPLG
jgi:hypothetical protein